MIAPLTRRISVKEVASISVLRSASRQSTELAANASIAKAVSITTFSVFFKFDGSSIFVSPSASKNRNFFQLSTSGGTGYRCLRGAVGAKPCLRRRLACWLARRVQFAGSAPRHSSREHSANPDFAAVRHNASNRTGRPARPCKSTRPHTLGGAGR